MISVFERISRQMVSMITEQKKVKNTDSFSRIKNSQIYDKYDFTKIAKRQDVFLQFNFFSYKINDKTCL